MATASAPGKIYLFGEHAVVYGEPAVPCAIDLRAQVTAQRRDAGVRIHAADLTLNGFTVEYDSKMDQPDIAVQPKLVQAATGYIDEAIAQARAAVQDSDDHALEETAEPGFDITVESDIPLGAGLGSSAAVSVATIDAVARELGVELTRAELADRAYRVERTVQDGEASRADTFCSVMGGAVRVEGDDCRTLETNSIPLVVGYDGGAGETGALVSHVRARREEYPFIVDTIEAIGDIVREGETALAAGDLETIGELMSINHGLLSALDVSARSLDAMVWAARDAGALGAKLTGAGGGGCIVALGEQEPLAQGLSYSPECEQAIKATMDTDGLRRGDG